MKTYLYFNEFNGNYYLSEIKDDKSYYNENKDLFSVPIHKETLAKAGYNILENGRLDKDLPLNPLPKFLLNAIKETLANRIKLSVNQELDDLRSSSFSKARLEYARLTDKTKEVESYLEKVKDIVAHEDAMLEHLENLSTLAEFFEFNRSLVPGWDYWYNHGKEHQHISVASKSFSTNSTLNLSEGSLNLTSILSSDDEDNTKNESVRKRNKAN